MDLELEIDEVSEFGITTEQVAQVSNDERIRAWENNGLKRYEILYLISKLLKNSFEVKEEVMVETY